MASAGTRVGPPPGVCRYLLLLASPRPQPACGREPLTGFHALIGRAEGSQRTGLAAADALAVLLLDGEAGPIAALVLAIAVADAAVVYLGAAAAHASAILQQAGEALPVAADGFAVAATHTALVRH